MDGESRRRGSVLLKGVRGIFPEIFEKSIDKHKIDAILNAPFRFGRSYERLFWRCGRRLEDSTEESGADHPDTESDEFRRELLCL